MAKTVPPPSAAAPTAPQAAKRVMACRRVGASVVGFGPLPLLRFVVFRAILLSRARVCAQARGLVIVGPFTDHHVPVNLCR